MSHRFDVVFLNLLVCVFTGNLLVIICMSRRLSSVRILEDLTYLMMSDGLSAAGFSYEEVSSFCGCDRFCVGGYRVGLNGCDAVVPLSEVVSPSWWVLMKELKAFTVDSSVPEHKSV